MCDLPTDIIDFLINRIKEKHIVNNILNIKKQFELYELKEKLLEKYGHWWFISRTESLTEDFIREFQDEVYWEQISFSQNLSEKFIREFQYKVNWLYIFEHQLLSKDFIDEFLYKLL